MVSMSEKAPEIRAGQVWKRKHDGRLVEVAHVANWPKQDPIIEWKGVGKRGSGSLFVSVFCRRYELAEAPDA